MARLIALPLAALLILGAMIPPARAGGWHSGSSSTATNVALGLASFAVFNQLFWPAFYPRPVYAAPPPVVYTYPTVYTAPPVYTVPAQAVAAPPPMATPTVVQYPHGRYELRGDGVTTAYYWVWIPNPPPPPPAPALPPADR